MSSPAVERPAMSLVRSDWRLVVVLGLLSAEVLIGQLSVHFAPPGTAVAAYWPNSGLSVIALCLAAPRWRPAVVGGVFGVSVLANYLGGRPWDVCLGFGLTNAAEAAVVVWWLVHGRQGTPRLVTLDDFARLIAATLVGATLGGFIAGATVALVDDGELLVTWRAVLSSHGAALLVLTPLGLQLAQYHRRPAGRGEAAAQWSMLMLTALLVFAPGQELPLVFLPFPLLIWGAIRLTPREVTWQLLCFATVTSALTTAGEGPFVAVVQHTGTDPELIGTLLQASVVASALVALPLSLVKTQQLITLDQLTESHQLVSNILASTTGNAILGTTLDGRIEFFNVGAERLSGYRAGDVVGRATMAVVPAADGHPQLTIAVGQEPDLTRLETLIEPFLEGGADDITADWEFVRRDGQVRTISVAISRRYGEDGEPVGFLGVADDVTERRRHESRVEAALESEKQIVERLAQVDQTKNDFLATVSHELRTPITSIMGYSQLLLSDDTGTLPAMHHQIVGRIERNGRRLMGLIEDMLTMSQVEVGNFRLHRVPIDLREPAQNALEAVQPTLAIQNLVLEENLGDSAVKVSGDADKLERVFVNLLSNAAKFSHPGDTIVVRLVTEADQAVFTVTDSGLGISLEDQAHLFDRFFRGADAHALAIQGVGLGLPIASSIVSGHEGRIEVASELGKGSTFVVRLPLLDEDPRAA